MYDLQVHSSVRDYSVTFVDQFETALRNEVNHGDIAIIDSAVEEHHAGRLENVLDAASRLSVRATEEQKSFDNLAPILAHISERGFRKGSKLIAVGGGVVQDVTSFVASIMFRGVDWIFFPTTLLAQCDSCIGGKTSINFGRFKNQLGNFNPPCRVYIDLSLLKTLPDEQLYSGLGEMVHFYLVSSVDDYRRFAEDAPRALTEHKVLRDLVVRTLQIKKEFIEKDEFDRNERQILNYGHSFGHALEASTDYSLPHGIAVSYGMDIANFISAKLGFLSSDTRDDIRSVLAKLWGRHPVGNLAVPEYVDALRRDKKNVGSTLGLILTRGPGRMFKTQVEVTSEFQGWLVEYFANETVNG